MVAPLVLYFIISILNQSETSLNISGNNHLDEIAANRK